MVFKAAYIFEKGKTMTGKFTWLSPVDATGIIKDSAAAVPRAVMLQNSLSPTRTMQGLYFCYGASPVKGCDLSLDFRQDLFGRQRDTLPAYGGRAYTVRAAVNDTLVPFLHCAEIFFRQTQTAFFYRDHYLLFGGMQLGVHAQSNPILFGTAVQAGLDYIQIDKSEALLEWYAGISWGAL
jgi:hypothetical protein